MLERAVVRAVEAHFKSLVFRMGSPILSLFIKPVRAYILDTMELQI